MTAIAYLRGHRIEWDGDQWVYSDNLEGTASTHKERPCGYCGEMATAEGHDPCIANLPDVQNACCGHGQTESAYVQFHDGTCVRGQEAVDRMSQLNVEAFNVLFDTFASKVRKLNADRNKVQRNPPIKNE